MTEPVLPAPTKIAPGQPVGTPGYFLDAAADLARQLSPEARAALAASWPADAPPPAVVAHMLSVMCADALACVSKGFVRMQHQTSSRPPKPPAPQAN